MLAARLVSPFSIRVELVLYGVDQLFDPQRAVMDDVDRIVSHIRGKLDHNSSQSELGCMRRSLCSQLCRGLTFSARDLFFSSSFAASANVSPVLPVIEAHFLQQYNL